MAKSQICDICGSPAITTAEFKTDTTTPLKWDMCQEHVADLKKIMRVFSKQDAAELVVTETVIEVKKVEIVK